MEWQKLLPALARQLTEALKMALRNFPALCVRKIADAFEQRCDSLCAFFQSTLCKLAQLLRKHLPSLSVRFGCKGFCYPLYVGLHIFFPFVNVNGFVD